ncbi:hypothetical protein HOA55_04740 [archaeon]|jgi:hypothetical protein|nr:hypothetical protein [archaeon]MBT3578089.1 hypothetical protein [archaeon]MBT6820637.1 hypothetical protein [archaeon]MBT7024953.1 hypothetical protein [archaeon]MBT7238572.1 hypothetical protein [archaeon]
MKIYYEAIDSGGKIVRGTVEASGEADALTKLFQSGLVPVAIGNTPGGRVRSESKVGFGAGIALFIKMFFEKCAPESHDFTKELLGSLPGTTPTEKCASAVSLFKQIPRGSQLERMVTAVQRVYEVFGDITGIPNPPRKIDVIVYCLQELMNSQEESSDKGHNPARVIGRRIVEVFVITLMILDAAPEHHPPWIDRSVSDQEFLWNVQEIMREVEKASAAGIYDSSGRRFI